MMRKLEGTVLKVAEQAAHSPFGQRVISLLTDPRRFLVLASDKTLLDSYETFSSYIILDKRLA